MPRVHISTTFEPTRVDYRELVGMGCAFGTVSHACATKCEKCEVGKVYVLHWKSFEDVSVVSNRTEREDMVVSQEDHTLYLLRKALLLSLVLIALKVDFTALWLHLRSLSSLPFLCQAPSHSSLRSQFLPFCRCNNETGTVVRTITTFCKQGILIAFQSGADVSTQATPLIAFLKYDKLHR